MSRARFIPVALLSLALLALAPIAQARETVSPQITDAVTETNVKVVGEEPSEAMSALYETIHNAVELQRAHVIAHAGAPVPESASEIESEPPITAELP